MVELVLMQKRNIIGWGIVAIALMSVGSVLLLRSQLNGRVPPLPTLGEAPDFQLTERSGKQVTRADLAGEVWVADFIFTRCPGMCPLLSTRMATLQQKLRETPGRPVKLVSFSVDPEWDTPERLQEYAQKYQALPEQWLFLTGPLPTMTQIITTGFHLGLVKVPPEEQSPTHEPLIHSDRLVLIDPVFQIRGYYQGADQDSFTRLWRDLETLRRQ